MVKALFDTNILVDYLNGISAAKVELERYRDKAISLITWMEVLVGATADEAPDVRAFLSGFVMLPIDIVVANEAIRLRQSRRIKLPDSIIWASARVNNRLLVTRDIKDFGENEPGIRMPYQI